MKSIQFPDMFNRTSTNIVSDYDATLQNMKMLLLSDLGTLFGDPYFGTGIKLFVFDLNDYILRDISIDKIYTALAEFILLIRVTRSDITIESKGVDTVISIRAMNTLTYTTDMYNIVLVNKRSQSE